MSSVFAAKDDTLDREVALKILSEEFSKDEKRIAAFEEEARLTASFSHPNVVRVLTTGRAFGLFYIAMEFVQGGHFERHIREKVRISELELLPLAIEVAEGLKGAQSAGLIHRDIKPGNILLDSEGHAKIVDFGLALVTQGGKAKATEIWATPYYVPPEAIEGGVEDFRADIYAFGATLYHALAGQPPCDEESMATDLLRAAKQKIVPLKKVAPDLSDETCAVVDRAMAYHPDERYGSYDEMISDLKVALKTAQGELATDEHGLTKSEQRARTRLRKRRYLIFGGIGALLAGIGFTALMVDRSKEPVKKEVRVLSADESVDEGAGSPEQIANRYKMARWSMEAGHFERAEGVFSHLLKHEEVQEPTRTWAAMEAIVAALLDGRMRDAKRHAAVAQEHLESGPAGLDAGFSIGVMPVLRRMDQWEFVQADKLDLGDTGTERYMGCLIAGLKNWEQGGLDQAKPFFELISEDDSLGSDPVLAWYQLTARKYLNDYQLLKSGAMDSQPVTEKECKEAIAELERIGKLLKTRGRAIFNVASRQSDFNQLAKSFSKIRKERPQPTLSPPDKPNVMDRLSELAASYRFVDLVDLVSGLDTDPPESTREALLAISQSALVFLSEMEADLAKRAAVVDFSLKSGKTIQLIAVSGEGKLLGKLVDGTVRDLSWSDFTADQLIELHRILVKNPVSEMERLRRHESAIAFDWLAGDRQRAISAADKLSAESAGFRQRWDGLIAGLPQ
ncbi:serine/threonine-protein kinase [Luteolibacter algae]